MDSIEPKIIFMGTSDFSKTILEGLLENGYNIISVYTQTDKKVGRDQKIQKSAVKILAEEEKIPVFEPIKFTDEVVQEIKKQKPDLIIVASYGKILPKSVLEIPESGCLNVHTSLLPKYRGPSPIQNAILNGETETGATIMLMNEGIDTGDILSQEKISIEKNENCAELFDKLAKISSILLLKTIPIWIERKIEPVAQNEKEATYCKIIKRNDGEINWSNNATSIYNQCRAFSPWPGVFTYFEKDGKKLRLKLHKISLAKNLEKKYALGEVFKKDEKVFVQTGNGSVQLLEVQLEGKNKIGIADFVRGYPEFLGTVLK
jgi:methionyl-tRNA formyltransferase